MEGQDFAVRLATEIPALASRHRPLALASESGSAAISSIPSPDRQATERLPCEGKKKSPALATGLGRRTSVGQDGRLPMSNRFLEGGSGPAPLVGLAQEDRHRA